MPSASSRPPPGPSASPSPRRHRPVLTGFVLEHDGKTRVPNQRVRLRNIDTGASVAETTSDRDGAFSFPVTTPGNYVVEAVSGGGVLAVSKPVSSTTLPFTRNVILPLKKPVAFFATAGVLLAAAAAVGIVAITKYGDDPVPSAGANHLVPLCRRRLRRRPLSDARDASGNATAAYGLKKSGGARTRTGSRADRDR